MTIKWLQTNATAVTPLFLLLTPNFCTWNDGKRRNLQMAIRWLQTNATAVTPLPAILPTGSCRSIRSTSGQYSKKSHKFPKWTSDGMFQVLLTIQKIIFRLFQECSRCSRTLHGPGWLWLRQLWKVLRKTFICWRNQLNGWSNLNDSFSRPLWKLDADEMLKKSAL